MDIRSGKTRDPEHGRFKENRENKVEPLGQSDFEVSEFGVKRLNGGGTGSTGASLNLLLLSSRLSTLDKRNGLAQRGPLTSKAPHSDVLSSEYERVIAVGPRAVAAKSQLYHCILIKVTAATRAENTFMALRTEPENVNSSRGFANDACK
ncbi:hypothetical protein L596_011752 [Steinernema carpocapsae]|uniref:Uncharacterized protein n=1 Tax=Steinernema carpocapsae TaxID=34508 RepID=A0A4U5NVU8_STECR|nr:hypothetical protein L596_011752 [Steinernema carpocapsae]